MPQTAAWFETETQSEGDFSAVSERLRVFLRLKTELFAAVTSLVVFWLTGRRQHAPLGGRASPRWLWQLSRALRALLVYEGVRIGLGQGEVFFRWFKTQRQRAQQLAHAVSDLSQVTRDTAQDLRAFVSAETADTAVLRRLERVLALLCTEPARELMRDLVRVAIRESRRLEEERSWSETRRVSPLPTLSQRPSLATLFREHCMGRKRPSRSTESSRELAARCEPGYPSPSRANAHWSTEWMRLLIESGDPGLRLAQVVVSTAVHEAARTLCIENQCEERQRRANGGHVDGARFRILSVLLNFAATEAGRRLMSESVAAAVASAMPILLEDGQDRQARCDTTRRIGPDASLGQAPGSGVLDLSVSTASSSGGGQTPRTPIQVGKGSSDESPALDRMRHGLAPFSEPHSPMSAASGTAAPGSNVPATPFLERIARLALREKEVLKEVASAAASEAVRSYLLTVNEMHIRQEQQQREHSSPLVKPIADREALDSGSTRAASARIPTGNPSRRLGHTLSDASSTAAYRIPPIGALPHSFSTVPLQAVEKLIRTTIKRLLLGACTTLQQSTEALRPPLDAPQWLFW
ncbi:hypothetical protein CCYA_CCYA11G3178 [Cyanidiococcus yangmingshanensis]|nr:hypothetical protein CCYA_CCYA11G3178 [Cyanidiococcus yangmingshanensis]